MDIEQSFRYAFKSEKSASKLVLGSLFTFLFFTVFALILTLGYLLRIMRSTISQENQLPDWGDKGALFKDGLAALATLLFYNLPVIALYACEQTMHAINGFSISVMLLFAGFHLTVGLLVSVMLPAAILRLAVTGSVKKSLRIGAVVSFIRTNIGTYFTAWGISLALGALATLGVVVLIVGMAFTLFAANVITAHLYAQAYTLCKPFPDDHGQNGVPGHRS